MFNKYEIVSKIAFLIGVQEHYFREDGCGYSQTDFDAMSGDKNCRVLRNLCILRNSFERNFGWIRNAMNRDFHNLYTMPELVDADVVRQLEDDGVALYHSVYTAEQYVVDINHEISQRISNCRSWFPACVNWAYLKDFFIMPDGEKPIGCIRGFQVYHANMAAYPYQCWVNLPLLAVEGNILANDDVFLTLLYEGHEDAFCGQEQLWAEGDLSAVSRFLRDGSAAVVVDCENSDPVKVCGLLKSLPAGDLARVTKLMLVDDENTNGVWTEVEGSGLGVPVEHLMTRRLKAEKSVVDLSLAVALCKEFYAGSSDRFLLCSSDSDYHVLFSGLEAIPALMAYEEKKVSPAFLKHLRERNVRTARLDGFLAAGKELQERSLEERVNASLSERMALDWRRLMDGVCESLGLDLADSERQSLAERVLNGARLRLCPDGGVKLVREAV